MPIRNPEGEEAEKLGALAIGIYTKVIFWSHCNKPHKRTMGPAGFMNTIYRVG